MVGNYETHKTADRPDGCDIPVGPILLRIIVDRRLTIKLLCTGDRSGLVSVPKNNDPNKEKELGSFKNVVEIDLSNRAISNNKDIYSGAKISDDEASAEKKGRSGESYTIKINRLTGDFHFVQKTEEGSRWIFYVERGKCEPAPKQLF